MKKHIYFAIAILAFLSACEPQRMEQGKMGPAPSNIKLTMTATDEHNPVFTAQAENGYIYHWDMGNGQVIAPGPGTVTSY